MIPHKRQIGTCEKCGWNHGYDLRSVGLYTYFCRRCFEETLTDDCPNDQNSKGDLCSKNTCKKCYLNSYASKAEALNFPNLRHCQPLRSIHLTKIYTNDEFPCLKKIEYQDVYLDPSPPKHFPWMADVDDFHRCVCPVCARWYCKLDHCNSDKAFTFISKAKDVHFRFYDYSFVKYINSNVKVEIICPLHSSFLITPKSHIQGHGCQKCAVEKRQSERSGKSMSLLPMKCFQSFYERARKVHNCKYDYDAANFTSFTCPVNITCHKHGKFTMVGNNHLRGQGCKQCVWDNQTMSTEDFIKKAVEVHSTKYSYAKAKYVSSIKPVLIGCEKHGSFSQRPSNHLQGRGCPLCGKEKIAASRRKNVESFILEAREIHKEKYDYSKCVYINNRTPGVISCPVHGDFQQNPYNHLEGYGCPGCLTE